MTPGTAGWADDLCFSFVTGAGAGGLPESVYPELRQGWWKWPDGPQDLVVAHDSTQGCFPAPIGIVRIFERAISWRVRYETMSDFMVTLEAAAIGGVFVAEGYRGQGVGSELLAATMRFLRSDVCLYDVAILHSGERELYSRSGFRPLGGTLWGAHLNDRYKHFESLTTQDLSGPFRWSLLPEGHF